jgi:GNAT superfamily N-acetyltransferase|tara:strand:+ start:1497 stop:1904 length:408 start_codon:yes stop_codon:yes gene_type:complete
MELNTRVLETQDWETLESWWADWKDWTPPPKDFLPNHGTGGFMVEKKTTPIVAGFVYLSNSKTAWLELIISNPEYREKDRKDAIKLLIEELEEFARSLGYKYMLTMGRNKHLIETHKSMGWETDNKTSLELIKKL